MLKERTFRVTVGKQQPVEVTYTGVAQTVKLSR
jgi:hypothetical protein